MPRACAPTVTGPGPGHCALAGPCALRQVATGEVGLCPCGAADWACISGVCVRNGSVRASAGPAWTAAPNLVHAAFFLWDDQCNPYAADPAAMAGGLRVEVRRANMGALRDSHERR